MTDPQIDNRKPIIAPAYTLRTEVKVEQTECEHLKSSTNSAMTSQRSRTPKYQHTCTCVIHTRDVGRGVVRRKLCDNMYR